MYLLLFCMHVQAKRGGGNESKLKSTSTEICFGIEPQNPKSQNKTEIKKEDCKRMAEVFEKISELVLKDETKFICRKKSAKKCKKCYCMCCSKQPSTVQTSTVQTSTVQTSTVQRPSVLLSTIPPKWNQP